MCAVCKPLKYAIEVAKALVAEINPPASRVAVKRDFSQILQHRSVKQLTRTFSTPPSERKTEIYIVIYTPPYLSDLGSGSAAT